MANAPRLIDRLPQDDLDHFAEVCSLLREAGQDFEVDTTLVRGLDYYTRTLFEFQSGALEAAQNTLGGGGRYDNLAEQIGGPHTPGMGWAAGVERMLMASRSRRRPSRRWTSGSPTSRATRRRRSRSPRTSAARGSAPAWSSPGAA